MTLQDKFKHLSTEGNNEILFSVMISFHVISLQVNAALKVT